MIQFAKKAAIDGKRMDVVTEKMYGTCHDLYANPSTAVEIEIDGEVYALPYRKSSSDEPGIYDEGCIYFVNPPVNKDDKEKYALKNLNIVDYNNAENVSDFLNTQQQLRSIDEELLTDIDDVYCPVIGPNDTEEMRALKTAIAMKQCDINKYADRFGSNYLNNKRLLKGERITMDKMILISKNLDMEVELIIRYKNPNVPNPMGGEVRAIITGGYADE